MRPALRRITRCLCHWAATGLLATGLPAAGLPAAGLPAIGLLAAVLLTGALAPARAQTDGGGAGVTYEIFVQSFADSDGDGIGDFVGMTGKLDYLDRLGAQTVWLLPIHPSPSYHKYDVTDYRAVHPDYGTMAEFEAFVEAAHARGIEVVIDLVINHTARAHPWFRQAVDEGAEGPYRDYYVWATPQAVEAGAPAARGGELDPDGWHDAPGEEDYYGFFWRGMPDLNFDNPEVRRALIDIGQFWLEEVGVDGFRLDAARHIYPHRRAADNHAWWAEFREAMREVDPDVHLVGEVWGPTEETAPYFGGLDALFNFDLSEALQEALQTGRADSLAFLHEDIRAAYRRAAGTFTDATFLTNHDQNRLRSVLGGSLKKAELGASLLFTLPGAPYVYYGEELGMLGEKPDPHLREPMLWQAGASEAETAWIDPVFSTEETVRPARAQRGREGSLLEHYRTLIALRAAHPALSGGEMNAVRTEAPSVSAFLRTAEGAAGDGETLLVVHNVATRDVTVALPAEAGGQPLGAFTEPLWSHAGVHNADRGNSALEQAERTEPALRSDGRLHLPGLSTLILRRP